MDVMIADDPGDIKSAVNESDDAPPPALLPHHLAELEASGVTADTAAANGVYSESDPQAVAKLLNWGAARATALGPVLVYPHFGRDGRPLGHATIKPDRPRDRSDKPGKVIKYENPRGRSNRLYVPVCTRPALADPAAPLVITEGCKKALAADQAGIPCVSLPGVWNWVAPRETRNGQKVGTPELNDDLAAIAWKGRPVYVCYDGDAAANPDVARAERAQADALARRGADVRVVRLPAEPGGGKNGLDDYLARHGADAFRRLVDAAAPAAGTGPVLDPDECTESGYAAVGGCTYHCLLERDPDTDELCVVKKTKLANFVPRIVGETVHDDGAEQAREFAVAVEQRGRPTGTAAVPVERFAALDWVVERLGPRYVIQPGAGRRDHLRCAMQELSGDVPSATVYTHTGWRQVGDAWHYLHGGGAIGPTGSAPGSVRVRLDGAAAGFVLPDPPAGDALRDAARASLGLLDGLAPDAVAFPLLAAAYRAPLGGYDFAVWLSGTAGVCKSELAALVQQHFGAAMTRTRLPGNWSSTDNALEGLAFTVKDAVLAVDDFAPPAARADADRQHRAAERLIRGVGNSAGRQRMRADGSLRPPKPPRALVVATGEDVPRGHSIHARQCALTVQRGDVELPRLSACQRDAAAGRYAAAMSGFLAWLAPRYGDVRAGLDAERAALRDQLLGKYPHARTPDLVANLTLGLRYLLAFAEHAGAIDGERRAALERRGAEAFRAVAERQAEHQRAADPVARFAEMLAAVIASGRGHVAAPDGKEPAPSPAAWGWADGRGRGGTIGWTRRGELYLDPDATYAALAALARDQGGAYPVTQQTLCRRQKEAGQLLRTDGDRTTYPETLGGTRRRVLVLAASVLGQPGQPGQPGQLPPPPEQSVPVSCPGSADPPSEPGQETGTDRPAEHRPVPAVPVVPSAENGEAADAAEERDPPTA